MVGFHEAWTSVYIPPLLTNSTDTIQVTASEGGWITISLSVGGFIGTLLSLQITDQWGRKITMLLTAVPYLVASVLLAYGNSLVTYCIARVLAGIATGVTLAVTPLYLGEIAHPKYRGILGTYWYIFLLTGFLIVNVVGSYLTITISSFISTGVVLLFVATFSMMPESPYFYILQDNLEAARKSLQRFRGRDNIDEEFTKIVDAIKLQNENSGKYKELFTKKSNLRALFIVFIVLNARQFTGDTPYDAYAQTIFQKISGDISPTLIAVAYYLTKLIVVIICSFLIDKIGRRLILLISLFVSGVILLLLGSYLYITLHTDLDFGNFTYISAFVLIIFAIFYSFLIPIPVIMLSELFPINVKVFASLLFGVYYFISSIVAIEFFHLTNEHFGMDVPFFAFGASCFVHFVLVYCFVFETKGRSLEDIQDYLELTALGNKIVQ